MESDLLELRYPFSAQRKGMLVESLRSMGVISVRQLRGLAHVLPLKPELRHLEPAELKWIVDAAVNESQQGMAP